VVVATDDARIFEAVESFGVHAVMTSAAHPSGTDRIAEVMRRAEFLQMKIVVNLQGDEPEVDPELIDQLIGVLEGPGGVEMATASAPFGEGENVANPNVVKVVTDQRKRALYFSRSVIPHDRDRQADQGGRASSGAMYRKHLGIYAYRREFLLTLADTPVCELERMEKLEQLRALFLGARIYVEEATKGPHGVDTPEDYAAFVARYHEATKDMKVCEVGTELRIDASI
jgi:3-deoxy-manno-octulosonate cytidylyltransferase (CMP-KDO synthetase)